MPSVNKKGGSIEPPSVSRFCPPVGRHRRRAEFLPETAFGRVSGSLEYVPPALLFTGRPAQFTGNSGGLGGFDALHVKGRR